MTEDRLDVHHWFVVKNSAVAAVRNSYLIDFMPVTSSLRTVYLCACVRAVAHISCGCGMGLQFGKRRSTGCMQCVNVYGFRSYIHSIHALGISAYICIYRDV